MPMRRTQWSEPGVSSALCWLALDDRKGNPRRHLPPSLYSDIIAPFLHFDTPIPNQLYAIGGRNQEQDPLDTMEMFDTWNGQWRTCPSILVKRAGCAAALLPDGKLLVVGGYDERGIVEGLLDTCETFDPSAQLWTTAKAVLRRKRWGHGCATLGGLVYAVGGCSLRPDSPPHEAFMETVRACEVYDPVTARWVLSVELCVARAGARVVTLGDRYLAAVGGCDDVFGRADLLTSVELFDSHAGHWALLLMQLSTPRTTAAVAALDDRRIMIVGGAPNLSSVELYQVPKEGTDSPLSAHAGVAAEQSPVAEMTEGRMGCQAVAIDLPVFGNSYPLCTRQCVVVVGGENGDEEWDSHIRQFSSVLVYDWQAGKWRPEDYFPPIPTPRTAMALCVGPGKVPGYR